MTSSREQFGRTARAYATSPVHARGADLDLLAERLGRRDGVLLDVGTGAGHTLVALAAKASRLVGLDPTPEMLATARDVLRERGVSADLVQGDADALPLREESVALVTCRIAAHHFVDAAGAFAEMARVLARGGRLCLIDNYAPDDPVLDDFINTLERTRDLSHVRAHTLGGWQELLARTGLRSSVVERWRTEIERESWLARAQTPEENAAEVRRRLRDASLAARESFGIHERGFVLHKALIVADKG